MTAPSRSLKELFLAALHVAPGDRAAWLERECAADADLGEHLRLMLAAHDAPQSLFDRPGETLPHGDVDPTLDLPQTEGPGTAIGPYKLLEQIGEGGFGVVFLAEQTQPVRRKVALKVLKAGMDTRQVVARFEAERQALAIMDHPNIAKVFDGGVTPAGRPYFVMELVRGVAITEYCDQNQQTPRQRLGRFVDVCSAVQHAHQKGIIHRDLKPSNVLVSRHDSTSVIKVIDFGVAKALGQELTDKTLFTGVAQMVGTPLYMSPEQAGKSDLDVDTRSDIYSLGVLLYELLTGTTPFDKERFKTVGYDEIRRIIREEDPPKPSTRISTLGQAATTVSANRQTDPRRLRRMVRGELDWILMKCLEKDRNRRYETANGLAADIRRYLTDEPILACPPSAVYRLRKFVRRYRAPVLAAAALLLALVGGFVGTTWGLVRAERARGLADERRAEADQALEAERQALAQEKRARYLYGFHLARREWELNKLRRAEQLLDECPVALRGWEWHYLKGLCRVSPLTSLNHESRVQAVAFSPDGRRLASACEAFRRLLPGATSDAFVTVWDVKAGKRLFVLRGHAGQIYGVAYSPDGLRLASAGEDRTVKVWDATTGAEVLTFRGHTGPVNALAYSPDGRQIASAGADKAVKIWDAATAEEVHTLPIPVVLKCVAYSPDGKRLAAGGEQGQVWVWDAATGKVVRWVYGHAASVTSLVYSPDGLSLASASVDGTVRVWRTATGKPLPGVRDPTGTIRSVAYNPDGSRLATGGQDGAIKVWDAKTGEEMFHFPGHTATVSGVAYSPDGRNLASAGSDKTVKLWDATSAPLVRTSIGYPRLAPLAFSPDGQYVATGSAGGTVQIRDAVTDREVLTLRGHTAPVEFVTYSPDGRRLVSGTGKRFVIRLPTNGRIALAGKKTELEEPPGEVKVWDVATGKEILTLGPDSRLVYDACYSPDGRYLATLSRDWTVKVWDAATGAELRTFRGHTSHVSSVAFSPDGRLLATSSLDQTVKIWDVATGAELRTFRGHTSHVSSLAFSPDGRLLATGSSDKTVKIWDANTGDELWTFLGHTGRVTSVAFSSDGRRLASGGEDKTIKILDATTGAEFLTLRDQAGGFSQLAFSADGWRLAAVGGDGTFLKVWDVTPPGQGHAAGAH
jgi:eukaryotic-like serine/threonine-protein kinase